MRYPGNQPRTTAFSRAPRATNDGAELTKIYQRYLRMGFEAREARFKAHYHHTMKL